jgi:outer membrane protein W
MRKIALLVMLFSPFIVPAASAQKKNEVSVFLSDISTYSNTFGKTHWFGGVGVAYNAMITPRISGQLAVAIEQHKSYSYIVDGFGGFQQVTPQNLRTYPIDLSARYHFINETRWKPYLGLGARYVGKPHADPGFRYSNHLNAQAVGGVEFLVKPQLGITLDGKQLLGDRDQYDPFLKVSLGVSWRF